MKRASGIACGFLALLLPTVAQAIDLPVRKAGLWEIKLQHSGGGMPDMTMQHCTDPAVDAEMSTSAAPMAKDACSKNDVTKTATGYATDSVCKFGPVTSRTRSEITGDFNSAYTVKITSQSEGGPKAAPADTTMMMEAKWVGACKADQRPGDVVMPGGMKLNVRDVKIRSPIPK